MQQSVAMDNSCRFDLPVIKKKLRISQINDTLVMSFILHSTFFVIACLHSIGELTTPTSTEKGNNL